MTYTQPLILVFALVGAYGLLRCTGRKWLAIAGFLGLVLISWPPVDWLFSRPLEYRYPLRPVSASPVPQAIVVFSSSVAPPIFERPYPLLDYESFQRSEMAVWLHKQWPALPVLACGGPGGPGGPNQDASSMGLREFLRRGGVPETMIWTEEQSRSTYENAYYGAEILRRHGIREVALVVDGSSMPRAAACLRKQGIKVLPAPCDLRDFGSPWSEELIPTWRAVQRNERTLHEMLGLVWYRLKGRI